MRNKLRVINAVVIFAFVILFIVRGLAQPVTQQQVQRNAYSLDVMQDRADRLDVRVNQVEAVLGARGDRLTRIESTIESQGRIIWALLLGLIGIAVDRAMAAKRAA